MLTWGLLRTNFSFDTDRTPLGAGSGGQLFTNLQGNFSVVVKLHRVGGSAFGAGPEVGCITEHRGHRNETGDGLYTRACGNSSDFSPSGMQITEDIPHGFFGSYDLE